MWGVGRRPRLLPLLPPATGPALSPPASNGSQREEEGAEAGEKQKVLGASAGGAGGLA